MSEAGLLSRTVRGVHVTLAVVDAVRFAEELDEDDDAGISSKGNAIESCRALEP